MKPLTSDRGPLSYNGGCYLSEAGRAAVERECAKLRAEREFERESERFRALETRDPEDMDFPDLCLFAGVYPWRIRAMVEGVDRHDECSIEAAIRVGIHRFAPALDRYAQYFPRHFYMPAHSMAEAAE